MPTSKLLLVAIPRSRHSCIRPQSVLAPHVAFHTLGSRSLERYIPLPVVERPAGQPIAAVRAALVRERLDMASTVLELVRRM